jgi:hypothetical protein
MRQISYIYTVISRSHSHDHFAAHIPRMKTMNFLRWYWSSYELTMLILSNHTSSMAEKWRRHSNSFLSAKAYCSDIHASIYVTGNVRGVAFCINDSIRVLTFCAKEFAAWDE